MRIERRKHFDMRVSAEADVSGLVRSTSSECLLSTPRITYRRKRAKPAVAGQVHAVVMRHLAKYFVSVHNVCL